MKNYGKILLLGCIIVGINVSYNQETNQFIDMPKETKVTATELKKMENTSSTSSVPIKNKVEQIDATTNKKETKKSKYAHWEYDEKTHCLTISGTGATHDDADFRDTLEGYFFEDDANKSDIPDFNEKWEEVKEVVIKEGVTSISVGAFHKYTNLEKVTIPNSVKKLSDYVFYGCESLKEITIPDGVTTIGERCFYGCTSLKKIEFGKNVKQIGYGNFGECESLRKITVSPYNKTFITKNGILYNNKKKSLVFAYANPKNVTIPKGTKIIGEHAFFMNPYLQKVQIPATVTTIKGAAFYRCKKLKKVKFAKYSKCTNIKSDLWFWGNSYGNFMCCNKLKEMILPESLKRMGFYTLYDCASLKKVYFGKSFEGMDDDKPEDFINCFGENTSIKKVVISKYNKYFSSEDGVMFDKYKKTLFLYPHNKSETKYKVPKSVNKIATDAFRNCKKLKSLIIYGEKTKFEKKALSGSRHIKIYGKKKSTAQKFAKKHKMKFVAI